MAKYLNPRNLFINGVLFCALAAFILALTFFYVSSEHTFYAYDNAAYQNITHFLFVAFQHSLSSGIAFLVHSMHDEYNSIFALLLLPASYLFGESRLAYELSVAAVYLLPFSLVLGGIATQIVAATRRRVFWTTVLAAVLTPVFWLPTLRGYPDTGSAVLIGLAMWLYLQDSRRAHLGRLAVIGGLLTMAVLFRRHFAFDVVAFFGAMTLEAVLGFILQSRRERRPQWALLGSSAWRIFVTGVISVVTLLIIGRPFLERVLATNYLALYASYAHPWTAVVDYFARSYGWLTWLLAALGFVLGLLWKTVRRTETAFVALYSSLAIVIWVFIVREKGEHYTLHMMPFIVLGLAILGWTIWLRAKASWRPVGVAFCALYLCLSMLVALGPTGLFPKSALRSLFPRSAPPAYNSDYPYIVQLVDFLRAETDTTKFIYVEVTNGHLKPDFVRSAERTLYGWDETRLKILHVPKGVPSDDYPLDPLLKVDYVVLLAQAKNDDFAGAKKKMARVVLDLFESRQGLAQDFEQLPHPMAFGKNYVVKVYKRTQPTSSASALTTLRFVQQQCSCAPADKQTGLR